MPRSAEMKQNCYYLQFFTCITVTLQLKGLKGQGADIY